MYRIYLLGSFRLEDAQGKILNLAYQNVQLLLSYLILHKDDWHRREALAVHFWPETEKSGNNFRNALHAIRSVLEPVDEENCILSKPGTVKWNPDYPYWLDAESLEELIEESQRLTGEAKIAHLRKAADLYRGNLLEGGDAEWIEPIRSYYERHCVSAVGELVDYFQELGEYQTAIDYAEWITFKRPYQDDIHYKLMLLHLVNKDRVDAMRVYEAFADRLKQDLGKDYRPAKELTDLYVDIVQGSAMIPEPPAPLDPIELGSPFVGREAEMQHFLHVWAKVGQGKGQTLILSGEAGIGKSRLAQEYERYARNEGGMVFRSRCYEQEQMLPYVPLIDALRRMITTNDEIDWECVPDIALSDVIKLVPELQQHMPHLEPSPPLATPEQEQNRLLSSFSEVFGALGENQTVVLVLDDVAWADEATLSVLHRLIRRGAQCRLLLLLTYREGDVPEDHMLWRIMEELHPDHPIHNQALLPLEHDYVHEMAAGLLQSIDGADLNELVSKVLVNAGGNAFFVEELIRFLIDEGILQRDSKGQWQVQLETFSEQSVPDNVQRLIITRLRRLSHEGRQLLEFIAVMGRSFTAELLTHMLGPWQQEWLKSMDELLWGRYLDHFDGEYQFHHKMIKDVVYQALKPTQRPQLHVTIASTYESLLEAYPERELKFLGDIAYHYDQAKQPQKALPYYLKAGHLAWSKRYAKTESLHQYDRALELSTDLNNSDSQCRAYMGRCQVCAATSEYDQAIVDGEKALTLCGSAVQRAEIHVNMAIACHQLRMHQEACSHCEIALKEVDTKANPLTAIKIYRHLGTTLNWLQRFEESIECLNKALLILKRNPNNALKAQVLSGLGHTNSNIQDFKQAAQHLSEAVKLAEATKDPISIAETQFSHALALYRTTKVDEAVQVWKKALRNVERYGNPQDQFGIYNRLFYAYLRQKNIEQASQYAKKQLETAKESKVPGSIAAALGMLACIYDYKGSTSEKELYFIEAQNIAPNDSQIYINVFFTYLHLERLEDALKWLKKGLTCRYLDDHQVKFLQNSTAIFEFPPLEGLQKDPRFQKIMQE